jgi:predicted aspartyl protease
MITGYLDQAGRAVGRLKVRGTGEWQMMACEIDTGAQPELVSSRGWVELLAAPIYETSAVMTLADGRVVCAGRAIVEVDWFEQARSVDVVFSMSSDADNAFRPPDRRGEAPNALLGRGLLTDCRLTIDYGAPTVRIEPSLRAIA